MWHWPTNRLRLRPTRRIPGRTPRIKARGAAAELQVATGRQALPRPDVGLDRLGVGRAAVGPLEAQGRAGAGHEQTGHSVAGKRDETSLVKVPEGGPGGPIDALG